MNNFEYFLIGCCLLAIFTYIKIKIDRNKNKYIDSYNFPDSLNRNLKEAYPKLSEEDIKMILEGLKSYFKLYVTGNRRTIVMPSRIIDRAWYEFILNTQEYEIFCKHAFERVLDHAPLKTMEDKNTASKDLKIVWTLACNKEGIDVSDPHKLPLIFSLDALLNIPDGFRYTLDCKEIEKEEKLTFCAKNIGSMGISSAYGGRTI